MSLNIIMANKTKPEVKIAMIMAINEVLEYKKKNPNATAEEILQHVMNNLKAKGEAKIGAMVAASHALQYKENNPEAKDKEVIQLVMNKSTEILNEIAKE